MSVSLLIFFFQQFFRCANHWKGEAGGISQFSQFGLNECIGYVPAVPTQKYIHFVNCGEGDVRGVAKVLRPLNSNAKNRFASLFLRRYICLVTATAEQVLEKIKSLPPADLREVCQAVLQWTAQVTSTSLRDNG